MSLLAETLESVLDQTYSDLEVLVVDNESEDDTEQYVESLTMSACATSATATGATSRSIATSPSGRLASDWIAFCDDDDLWLPGKLESADGRR